jgi:hypothetical protein
MVRVKRPAISQDIGNAAAQNTPYQLSLGVLVSVPIFLSSMNRIPGTAAPSLQIAAAGRL